MKKILIATILFLIALPVYASTITIDVIKKCELKYCGDSCEVSAQINSDNPTTIALHTTYDGICSEGKVDFDGVGITVNGQTNWENGRLYYNNIFPEEVLNLNIKTVPNLCPGSYEFILEGETEDVSAGGTSNHGGGGLYIPPKTVQKPKETITIVDGDLIRNPNAEGLSQLDVYIVKIINGKKFKRLIISPHVFESYGHFDKNHNGNPWDDIIDIDQETMNQFTESNLVRAINDYKVYRLTPNGDTGTKEWLNMTAEEFGQYHDWDSIYIINKTDLNFYK